MKTATAASAIRRGLRYAIATAVLALCSALGLASGGAERCATVAYLATIFAAAMLLAGSLLPPAAIEARSSPTASPSLPAALGSCLLVGAMLLAGAAFATAPGSEVLLFCIGLALVAFAAFDCAALCAAAFARLTSGGRLAGLARCSLVLAVAAFAIAAVASPPLSDGAAWLGFWLIAAATLFVMPHVLEPSLLGRVAGRWGTLVAALARRRLEALEMRFVICAAALVAVAYFAFAALFPAGAGEAALAGYLAIALAAAGLLLQYRSALSRGSAPNG